MLCIDEILVGYSGRCGFKMFIPSKNPKFGIKLFLICDPKTMYLLDIYVYLGKEELAKDEKLGEKVKIGWRLFNLSKNLGCHEISR